MAQQVGKRRQHASIPGFPELADDPLGKFVVVHLTEYSAKSWHVISCKGEEGLPRDFSNLGVLVARAHLSQELHDREIAPYLADRPGRVFAYLRPRILQGTQNCS